MRLSNDPSPSQEDARHDRDRVLERLNRILIRHPVHSFQLTDGAGIILCEGHDRFAFQHEIAALLRSLRALAEQHSHKAGA